MPGTARRTMSRTGKTERRQGMALVEVLVAVVIFFAAFAALLRVYAMAASALDVSESTVASTLAAQDELESMPLVVTNAGVGIRDGAAVVPGYVCRVDRHAVPGTGPVLSEVELLAGRQDRDAAVVAWTRTVPSPL